MTGADGADIVLTIVLTYLYLLSLRGSKKRADGADTARRATRTRGLRDVRVHTPRMGGLPAAVSTGAGA